MHLDALPKPTRQLFDWLAQKPYISSFYLAGGTAVSLYYGHRYSQDLDFFTPHGFRSAAIKKKLSEYGQWRGLQQEWRTLVGEVKKTKVSFFTIEDKLLKRPTVYKQIRIAHPLDLALMKILAISDRGTKRDFIDLYILHHQFMPLPDLMLSFAEKYGKHQYNFQHIVRSLGYFADAEMDAMPMMRIQLSWPKIKTFFHQTAEALAKKFLD